MLEIFGVLSATENYRIYSSGEAVREITFIVAGSFSFYFLDEV